MHILIVSDLETQGGAAIAASRLAQTLCCLGHQVTRIAYRADNKEHSWLTIRMALAPYDKVLKRIVPGPIFRKVATRVYEAKLWKILKNLRPDAINIHNLHWAAPLGWSPDLLRICTDWAPSIWTLHDMWSFTGRCAYSYDCRKFIVGCDSRCPTAYEYPSLAPKLIRRAWRMRRRLLESHMQLAAVTPSRWLAREAQAGLWAEHNVGTIPNGLPLSVFTPLERHLARHALGISTPGTVLLFSAANLADRRKGGDLLESSLRLITHKPLTIIALGAGKLSIESEGISVHSIGYVDHERTRVLAYNAADILVHPAPVDNLPNVVMEAIACGTPVVAFAVGGVPEMVRQGETGWLADEVSSGCLGKTLDRALSELSDSADLRQRCRAVAEAEFCDKLQAHRYLALMSGFGRTST